MAATVLLTRDDRQEDAIWVVDTALAWLQVVDGRKARCRAANHHGLLV